MNESNHSGIRVTVKEQSGYQITVRSQPDESMELSIFSPRASRDRVSVPDSHEQNESESTAQTSLIKFE